MRVASWVSIKSDYPVDAIVDLRSVLLDKLGNDLAFSSRGFSGGALGCAVEKRFVAEGFTCHAYD